MNVRSAIETFSRYSPQKKTEFLLQFADTLTILARDPDTYGAEGLTPSRRRLVDVQHRVISFLMALIKNEEKRYPDENFVRMILEHPEDSELQRRLQEAFDHPEAGAAPTPEVFAHCVPGTLPRGWWWKLLRNAGYPFRRFSTLRAIKTFSSYSRQKKTDFLLHFSHALTILARGTHGEEALPSRLRLISEAQHRVIMFLKALIKNEGQKYSDQEFVRIILERPERSEVPRQLREAFDLMVQVVASISEVGTAPPKVLVQCVHGTFLCGMWRQLLKNAGYSFPGLKKESWFDPDSQLQRDVRANLGGCSSDTETSMDRSFRE